jgi:transcriptional regulator with XRE-family HTH domain
MRAARIYVPNVQLRERRLRRNLTLEEVADALTALAWERFAVRVGVNAGMVGKWERGEKRPSRFYQRLFVLLYGVPAEQLGFRRLGRASRRPRTCSWSSALAKGPRNRCCPTLRRLAGPACLRLP